MVPSSLMSTLAPDSSTIERITLPPEPMTSRILSTAICMVSMRGAWAENSVRPAVSAFDHLAEDVHPAVLRLGERLLHDRRGDAGDLDVHLQRGDAVRGAGDLEVHVAEVVLVAEDVGQDRELLAFEDQAHGDAGDRRLQRHAAVHHRQRRRRRPSPSRRSRSTR